MNEKGGNIARSKGDCRWGYVAQHGIETDVQNIDTVSEQWEYAQTKYKDMAQSNRVEVAVSKHA
jgi:hypothetical protein